MVLALVLGAAYALFGAGHALFDRAQKADILRTRFSRSALLLTVTLALGYFVARSFLHASFNTSFLPQDIALIGLFFVLEELFYRGFLQRTIGPLPALAAFIVLGGLLYNASPAGFAALAILGGFSAFLALRFGIAYSALFRLLIPAIGIASTFVPTLSLEALILLLPFTLLKFEKPGWRPSTVLQYLRYPKITSALQALKEFFEGAKLFVAIFIAVIALGFVLNLLGLLDTEAVAGVVRQQSPFSLFLAITLAPIAEELFFRGFLQRRIGILFTSVIFAVLHFGFGSIAEILAAFLAALILGYYVERRASKGQSGLVATMFAHAFYNAFAIIAIGMSV